MRADPFQEPAPGLTYSPIWRPFTIQHGHIPHCDGSLRHSVRPAFRLLTQFERTSLRKSKIDSIFGIFVSIFGECPHFLCYYYQSSVSMNKAYRSTWYCFKDSDKHIRMPYMFPKAQRMNHLLLCSGMQGLPDPIGQYCPGLFTAIQC